MPDDPNTTQETAKTPISEDTPVNMGSGTPNNPPEVAEAPVDNSTPEVVNNTAPENTENKAEMVENGQNAENTLETQASASEPLENKPETSQISKNAEIPAQEPVSTETAQIPGNEPFENTQDKPLNPQPEPIKPEPVPVIVPNKNKVLELLNKAKLAIQSRKRKKLDKIMTLFLSKSKITNDEVEKFLHVSDATATRYLSQLEKENKIRQTGKTGHAVSYSKI